MAGAQAWVAATTPVAAAVHLAMDPATSDIRAVEFTPGRAGDSPVLPELLGRIPAEHPSITSCG